MRILIIGKGGREHALAWKCSESPLVKKIFVAPGNAGIEAVAECVPVRDDDIKGLVDFALREEIDLTIVGPESALALGVVNAFQRQGLKIFGPTQEAAQIESSKDFAKKLMRRYDIPTADYCTFDNLADAQAYVQACGAPIVIKEDGLKAGKGVTVALTIAEALSALEQAFVAENRVVIEEYLDGFEYSLIALVSNGRVIPLEIAQDHKRAFDNDQGPNTGGMGVYSPVRKITPELLQASMEQVMIPAAKGLISEGIPFTGFLYGGMILTEDGIKTIEFNARFGDPEAQVILPRLKSDLVQAIIGMLNGTPVDLVWEPTVSVGVVMASEGYPASSTSGAEITFDRGIKSRIFHMGTARHDNKLVTAGGRVLIVVAQGQDFAEARAQAYADIKKIHCPKLFYRTDIGMRALT